MNLDTARSVADAVLYEGYVLYPYRASSAKNQVRWQFGVLVPRGYAESGGSDPWEMQTECLLDPGDEPRLEVPLAQLDGLWTQDAVVWWPEERAAATGIAATRQALVALGFAESDLVTAVARFQQQTSLVADGRLGPRTRMALYALSAGERPRLSPGGAR